MSKRIKDYGARQDSRVMRIFGGDEYIPGSNIAVYDSS